MAQAHGAARIQQAQGLLNRAWNELYAGLREIQADETRGLGMLSRQASTLAPSSGRVQARRATAAHVAGTRSRKGSSARQRKGTLNRWVADNHARRVPGFVETMTGLDSAVAIKAKFGNGAIFEQGKPLPKPIARKGGK